MSKSQSKIISIKNLRAGNVLLCYKNAKIDPVGKKITKETDSEYTHAAICINDITAAESLVSDGVSKNSIKELICRYDHVAVFRQPDAWSKNRVQALQVFIEAIIESGAKYNLSGVVKFRSRKDVHEKTLFEQLALFFDGKLAPAPTVKGKYFYSELVADCFVAVGFIAPSAAVQYQSNVTSPGALGRDPTFGTFYGYVSCVNNYQVPPSDEFINTTTFNEIFKNEI